MSRLARGLVAARYWLLAAGLLIGAACLAAPPLPFDRSVENMFAPDDPVRQAYQRLTTRFAANEIVLAVYVDPQLLTPDGLRRLEQIAQRLREVPGVRDVLSLAQVNDSLRKMTLGLLGGDTPPLLRDSALSRQLLALFQGFTHGEDEETAAVVCLLAPRGEDTSREATIAGLRAVIRDLPDEISRGALAGEPVMVADGFRFVERDGQRLATSSTLLIAACIGLLFRSLRWMLIPLAVVQLALLMTRASLATTGVQLTLVSSMMAAMVTVIGVAAMVHVIVGVRREMSDGAQSVDAVRTTAARLGPPIFWSIATDAVGFAALMASDVGPVRDYGLMMCVGSLMVLPALVLLTPGLALLGRWDTRPRRAWGESHLDDGLALSSSVIRRHPGKLAITGCILALVAAAGIHRLQLETDFTKNFRRDNPLVASYDLVEERLGGAGVWDVMLPAPDTLDAAYLARVDRLQQQLRQLTVGGRKAFTKVLSLQDAVAVAGRSAALRWATPEMRAQALGAAMPAFSSTMRARDQNGQAWLHVMLRSRERQPAEDKQRLIAETRRLVEAEFPGRGDEPPGEVSGFFVLLTDLVQTAIRDQWRCFAIAIAGILLTLTLALRSLLLAGLALLTNIAPVMVVLGLVGWAGVKVNLGVAMIAAVALGLSVDSSLQLLFAFRRRLAAGDSLEQALAEVQQGVGRAMLFSTVALVSGFMVLTTSPFVPTVTFGLLTALALAGGLVGNLIALPSLLMLTHRSSASRSSSPGLSSPEETSGGRAE